MSWEYGIGANVVRCTFYMSASLPKLSSPERKREKKNRTGVGATNFRLWTCSNHTSSFGNLRESHHISLCIRGVGRSKTCRSLALRAPRQFPLSGSSLGQWKRHGVTEVYLSGSLRESGTYLVGGTATVLARVRRQPVAS